MSARYFFCPPLRWIGFGFALLAVASAHAQTFPQDLDRAGLAYQAGHYEDAAAQLQTLLGKYAQDPLMPTVRNRLDYLLVLSLVQTKKWDQIPAVVDDFINSKGNSPASWSEELLFWKGRALLSSKQPAEARGVFEAFQKTYPASKRAPIARLLLALSMLQAGQWNEAADLLARMRQGAEGADWGRFLLLETTARINANQTDRALDLVDEGNRNLRLLTQITAFELSALELAEKLIDQPDKGPAIRALIRIPSRESILKLQDQQLAQLEQYYQALEKRAPKEVETVLTKGLIDQIKQERDEFAKVPDFDASVRFRIAKAFLDAERYRETAFVLEGMLDELPTNPIVEQGTETLAQCYTQIGRADKVIEVADKFLKKFPTSAGIPNLLVQKGLALQNLQRTPESDKVFDEFLVKYPGDPLAPNASFLRAFNDVIDERFSEAATRFQEMRKKFPDSPVAANALYWEAQANSLGKRNDLALPLYREYLQKFPEGEFAVEARYREAFSLFDLRDYEAAVPALEKFVADHPQDPNTPEGMLLLGDAYFSRQEYDRAIALLQSVPKGGNGYREEAYFKIAKYYKLSEEPEKLRELLEKFQTEFPDSSRLSEAVYLASQTVATDPAAQRKMLWDAYNRFADQPAQWGVTELVQGLVNGAKTPEARAELVAQLRSTQDQAAAAKKRVLQINTAWGQFLAEREKNPAAADAALRAVAPLVKPEVDNPAIVLGIAQALQRDGKLDEASGVYREIRRWNPLSPLNQTVFADLGRIAFKQGRMDEARAYFERYFAETPASDQRGLVMLTSAEIERDSGNMDQALEKYEKTLADKGVGRAEKAAALLAVGKIYLDRKMPDRAIPYFQRIYILYSAFPEFVSPAYLESARAFEAKGDNLAAARTYLEMINQPVLAAPAFSEARSEAQSRLDKIPAEVRDQAEKLEKEKRDAGAAQAGL